MTTSVFISTHTLASARTKKTISVVKFNRNAEPQQGGRVFDPPMTTDGAWHVGLFEFSSSSDGSKS